VLQCLMCLNDVAVATVNPSKACVPWFIYVNKVKKTSLKVHFLYLGKVEIYWIFKMCCIISVLLPTEYRLFHNFIFFHSCKVLGYIHIRKGPNKVGFVGILRPFRDAIKLFTREQYFPLVSNYLIHYFSHIFGFFLSLLV
jgi:NADH:ubiquinone oxidoreductase subunit H